MITVHFVDEGQDFLRWDIDDEGRVVDCQPFQGDIWIGTKVLNEKIMPGDLLNVTTPDGIDRTIAHAVEKVQQKRERRPREAILNAIKQDLQSLLENNIVDFATVRKLADIATAGGGAAGHEARCGIHGENVPRFRGYRLLNGRVILFGGCTLQWRVGGPVRRREAK